MANYLYAVRYAGKTETLNHWKFKENVGSLNAKTGDYAGIQRSCVISHHMDAETVKLLCTNGFTGGEADENVQVVEITSRTMYSAAGIHRSYIALFENYYSPYNQFPNLQKK